MGETYPRASSCRKVTLIFGCDHAWRFVFFGPDVLLCPNPLSGFADVIQRLRGAGGGSGGKCPQAFA